MKKISLKNLNLKETEQLSREQLKNVLGGWTGGTGGTGESNDPPVTIACDTSQICGGYDANYYYRSGKCYVQKATNTCLCSSAYGTC